MGDGSPIAWDEAVAAVHAAGRAAAAPPVRLPIADCDGLTLAEPLVSLTDLPAFPTSSVDGYALRGAGPWRLNGRVLAGHTAEPIADGTAIEIATGAMVPAGTEHILRVEESTLDDDLVSGTPRSLPEWREPGDEAHKGDELLPAGIPVTPAVIGLAAACGYDTLAVRRAPRAALLVFGDELRTAGPPGDGQVRDALGPQVPGWLRRLGAEPLPGFAPRGPIEDTLEAHVGALKDALEHADLVCTTGGTMHGPVDHLHPALAALGARYVVNTVAVRPGFPMLVAQLPDGKFVAGLPGNPQSAIVALMSLVEPLIAGLHGRAVPPRGTVTLGEPVPGRGGYTHLALVRVEADGLAYPLRHSASAMLRGLARSDGFAVIVPGGQGDAGAVVPLVPLPMFFGARP
ncbi:molybdopterin molybdotransferase MoeA [Luedemannella helvata]|uniref:molybdopterin molybdotransferase MoeA n=1 Tax=Luedemannella helvata TaxID=349315 RepID=UPI0031DD3AFF